MAGRSSVTLDNDLPEQTDAELAAFKPAREVLSADQFAAVLSVRRGRPKLERPKVPVTLRLDADVVDAFKATGKGWQTKVNAVLREATTGRFVASNVASKLSEKAGSGVAVETDKLKTPRSRHRAGSKVA